MKLPKNTAPQLVERVKAPAPSAALIAAKSEMEIAEKAHRGATDYFQEKQRQASWHGAVRNRPTAEAVAEAGERKTMLERIAAETRASWEALRAEYSAEAQAALAPLVADYEAEVHRQVLSLGAMLDHGAKVHSDLRANGAATNLPALAMAEKIRSVSRMLEPLTAPKGE